MSQVIQYPPSTPTHAYPNLTLANHKELAAILGHLDMTAVDHGSYPNADSDWPLVSPKAIVMAYAAETFFQ